MMPLLSDLFAHDTQHFFYGGKPLLSFLQAVFKKRRHPLLDCLIPDLIYRRLFDEKFENTNLSVEAAPAADITAPAFIEQRRNGFYVPVWNELKLMHNNLLHLRRSRVRSDAGSAYFSHKALRNYQIQRGCDEERVHAHIG